MHWIPRDADQKVASQFEWKVHIKNKYVHIYENTNTCQKKYKLVEAIKKQTSSCRQGATQIDKKFTTNTKLKLKKNKQQIQI